MLWNRLVGTCGPERNIARLGDTPRRAFPYYSGRAKLETFLGAALPPPSFQRYPSPPQGGRPIGLAAFCFRPRSLDSHTTITPVSQENRPLDPLESVLAHADSRMRWARSRVGFSKVFRSCKQGWVLKRSRPSCSDSSDCPFKAPAPSLPIASERGEWARSFRLVG